ncbi:MAG: septum formation inhibitor Maf [Aquaticitalea sp.]
MKFLVKFLVVFCIVSFATSCKDSPKTIVEKKIIKPLTNSVAQVKAKPLSMEFKSYWYNNEAEITSYKLDQARYGEMRSGTAVLVYVTEPFLRDLQVKADKNYPTNIPVLKLNAIKKFNTGIYPYSIMQSTFYPVANNEHALKVSCSVQEWCGHVYTQLNNRIDFEVMSHSYFENEADEDFNLEKTILENELWIQLRINPKSLPVGDQQIIPSLEFLRLRHVPLKGYQAKAQLTNDSYSVSYPELNRSLTIHFNPEFPYDINGWEETFMSGFGQAAKQLTTKATKIATIKSDYWNKNSNADDGSRKTLGLN